MQLTVTPLAVYRPTVVGAQVALVDRLRLLRRRVTLRRRHVVDVNPDPQTASKQHF
jgi:hypothetical protein